MDVIPGTQADAEDAKAKQKEEDEFIENTLSLDKRTNEQTDATSKPTAEKEGREEGSAAQCYSRIVGQDVSQRTFEDMKRFAQQVATVAVVSLERDDFVLQLHIQAVLVLESTSTRAVKQDIALQLGWATHCSAGGAICVKQLTNKSLHTPAGMIGYCTKDEKESHYQVYSKNVTKLQFEEGRRKYVILGACD
ncbi:hypothetical protein R1sor_018226 [Riccia sorocarpa]|uniref:Replitron HUH endonuclease domain-containing protein n=1 Tax=Riccia sorocarpa TaxID=122646 RepID=A0ABD3IFA5_9MARC